MNSMYEQHMSPMDAMRHYPHSGSRRNEYRGGYGEQHRGGKSEWLEELSDWAYGRTPIPEEFKAVVCAVMKHQTDLMLAEYGYSQQEGNDNELHRRYKDTLEELREAPNSIDAMKRATQHFENLTDEEKRVLQQLVSRPSHKKMAQNANVPLDRFMTIKHELEYKLKKQ